MRSSRPVQMNKTFRHLVFFEFIPFTSEFFDDDGNLLHQPITYLVHEVKENVEYAVIISTCSGAWRYMIGDVIKFTNAEEYEIAIVGRTKQFLSMCGEHRMLCLTIDHGPWTIDH